MFVLVPAPALKTTGRVFVALVVLSSLNYFYDNFVRAGAAFDLDWHVAPFLFLFFNCGS